VRVQALGPEAKMHLLVSSDVALIQHDAGSANRGFPRDMEREYLPRVSQCDFVMA
jgi:hypothetical protein